MPELPEVETVLRKLKPLLLGAKIKDIEVRRARSIAPQQASDLSSAIGRKIDSLERRGKHILLHLAPSRILNTIRVHLGMTGELYVRPPTAEQPKSVCVILTLSQKRLLVFEDVRGLGRVQILDDAQLEKFYKRIGIEPLSRKFTTKAFLAAALGSRRPAKLFLLGQDRIAGIGNMYAAEALWRARIDPRKPMNAISKAKLIALHHAIPQVLREALKGAIKTYERPGSYDTMDFDIYGRKGEPCRRCKTPVGRIQQGGRSTYFCPRCQG